MATADSLNQPGRKRAVEYDHWCAVQGFHYSELPECLGVRLRGNGRAGFCELNGRYPLDQVVNGYPSWVSEDRKMTVCYGPDGWWIRCFNLKKRLKAYAPSDAVIPPQGQTGAGKITWRAMRNKRPIGYLSNLRVHYDFDYYKRMERANGMQQRFSGQVSSSNGSVSNGSTNRSTNGSSEGSQAGSSSQASTTDNSSASTKVSVSTSNMDEDEDALSEDEDQRDAYDEDMDSAGAYDFEADDGMDFSQAEIEIMVQEKGFWITKLIDNVRYDGAGTSIMRALGSTSVTLGFDQDRALTWLQPDQAYAAQLICEESNKCHWSMFFSKTNQNRQQCELMVLEPTRLIEQIDWSQNMKLAVLFKLPTVRQRSFASSRGNTEGLLTKLTVDFETFRRVSKVMVPHHDSRRFGASPMASLAWVQQNGIKLLINEIEDSFTSYVKTKDVCEVDRSHHERACNDAQEQIQQTAMSKLSIKWSDTL